MQHENYYFFFGIFAPAFRASLNPMATACFRLVTFVFPRDFNVPSLNSCITFSTLALPFVAFFAAGMDTSKWWTPRATGVCHVESDYGFG